MSSNEEEYNDADNPSNILQGLKKRRIQRACDICRRKKIRCDGVQMPGNRCSNCISYSYECTYIEAARKRGPPKGYVESLENRLEKLEKLIRRLCPDDNLLRELNSSLDKENWISDRSKSAQGSASTSMFVDGHPCAGTRLAHKHPCDIATQAIRGVNNPMPASEEMFRDDDNAHLILADNLKRLSIDPVDYRFFGKSSGAMLIQTAIELKNEYAGTDHDLKKSVSILGSKRPEFWSLHPWERSTSTHKRANYTFPEPDLITSLTDLYFRNVNLYLPLLHRPIFERSIEEGLHLKNDSFGATLLLACAVGSRFSEDPRVLLEGEESYHSCGWKWFEQVQMVRKSLLAPPSLYDLQFYCLSVQFLQGSSAPQSCWTMVGIGIRLAQDVGAHRRKAHTQPLTTEDELWKRAFWVLVCMDRMVSAALGRPCAIQDEDFDIDMPVECDDEYWEHPDPEQRWKQPANKPSLISAFNLYLKLNQVLAFSLRTIYSINKSKILLGFVGQQWEQHIVAELDSALNKWVDSVPDHLRWDPNREDDQFFNQSAVLYGAYYHIQILIHRPFIPSPSKPSPLSFPSLAICTNAARSCSHVVDMQGRRNPLPPPQIQMAVFTSGIVLLLSIWGGKRSGLSTDPNKEMADVHRCMQVLRMCEKRWHSAGRLWDILYELASVGDLPLPQASPPATNKRERDSETPISSLSESDSMQSTPSLNIPRTIAGSRRVQKEIAVPHTLTSNQCRVSNALPLQLEPQRPLLQLPETHEVNSPQVQRQIQLQSSESPRSIESLPLSSSQQTPPQQQQQFFTLPVYSDELGRIPLHGQVQFSQTGQSPPGQPNYWYNNAQAGPSSLSGGIHLGGGVNVGDGVRMTCVDGNGSNPIPVPVSTSNSGAQTLQQSYESLSSQYPASGSMNAASFLRMGTTTDAYDQLGVLHYPASGSFSGTGSDMAGGSGVDRSYGGCGGLPHVNGVTETRQRLQHSQTRHHQPRSLPSNHQSSQPQPQYSMHPQNMSYSAGSSAQHQQTYVDSDTMAMWSNAPTGFELDEWGTYLMNVSELTQGHAQQQQIGGPSGMGSSFHGHHDHGTAQN